jgi:hypothetical protein
MERSFKAFSYLLYHTATFNEYSVKGEVFNYVSLDPNRNGDPSLFSDCTHPFLSPLMVLSQWVTCSCLTLITSNLINA